MKFIQVDLDENFKRRNERDGEKLQIPEKIDLPYLAKIYHGKKFRVIQGENQVSQGSLSKFLRS